MDPHTRVPLVATIQQAIGSLLTTYEPEFLRIGYSLFLAFATIVLAWQGIRMMLTRDGLGDQMFHFAKLLVPRPRRGDLSACHGSTVVI